MAEVETAFTHTANGDDITTELVLSASDKMFLEELDALRDASVNKLWKRDQWRMVEKMENWTQTQSAHAISKLLQHWKDENKKEEEEEEEEGGESSVEKRLEEAASTNEASSKRMAIRLHHLVRLALEKGRIDEKNLPAFYKDHAKALQALKAMVIRMTKLGDLHFEVHDLAEANFNQGGNVAAFYDQVKELLGLETIDADLKGDYMHFSCFTFLILGVFCCEFVCLCTGFCNKDLEKDKKLNALASAPQMIEKHERRLASAEKSISQLCTLVNSLAKRVAELDDQQ